MIFVGKRKKRWEKEIHHPPSKPRPAPSPISTFSIARSKPSCAPDWPSVLCGQTAHTIHFVSHFDDDASPALAYCSSPLWLTAHRGLLCSLASSPSLGYCSLPGDVVPAPLAAHAGVVLRRRRAGGRWQRGVAAGRPQGHGPGGAAAARRGVERRGARRFFFSRSVVLFVALQGTALHMSIIYIHI